MINTADHGVLAQSLFICSCPNESIPGYYPEDKYCVVRYYVASQLNLGIIQGSEIGLCCTVGAPCFRP